MSNWFEHGQDGLVYIRFPDALDNHLFHDMRADCERVIKESPAKGFVLDASQLRSIDSTGIGLIAYLGKLAKRANLPIKIVSLSGQPADMFQFLRMDTVIPIDQFEMEPMFG